MGNKCCSKRQDPDIGCSGGKKNDLSSMSQQKYNNGSIDSRYTPDPNRHKGVGADFIRIRQPTRKYFLAHERELVIIYVRTCMCVCILSTLH